MSTSEYAALYAAVQARLSAESGKQHYGRNTRHSMAGCPACKVIVCISHHDCPRER